MHFRHDFYVCLRRQLGFSAAAGEEKTSQEDTEQNGFDSVMHGIPLSSILPRSLLKDGRIICTGAVSGVFVRIRGVSGYVKESDTFSAA